MRISQQTQWDWRRNMTTCFGDRLAGCVYDEELAGPDGVHIHVWVPADTDPAQLREIYAMIAQQKDIVSMSWDFDPNS